MSDQIPDDLIESSGLPDDLQSGDGASGAATVIAVASGVAAGWAMVRALRRRRSAPGPASPGATAETLAAGAETYATEDAVSPLSRGDAGAAPALGCAPVAAQTAYAAARASHAGDSRWSQPTKYLVAVGLLVFGLLLLYWSRGVISVIVTAALIAFIIRPLIGWFQSKLRFSRGLATVVSYTIVVLAILAVPLLVIPALWEGFTELQQRDFDPFYSGLEGAVTGVTESLDNIPVVGDVAARSLQPLEDLLAALQEDSGEDFVTPESIQDELTISLSSIGAVTGFVGPIVIWVIMAAFTLLISVYLTSSTYSLRRFVLDHLPPAYIPEVATLFDRIAWTWTSFLQGQLKLMVFIGVAVFLGNLAMGNPYAIVLGLLAGLLELIPSLGPTLALIPALFVALVFGSEWSWMPQNHLIFAGIVLAFYLLVQAFENQYIVPRVLGDAVELPPLVVLVGVLVGGSIAGILGALIAVPVIGTGKEVISYLYGKIIEAPAIEAPPPLEPGLIGNLKNFGRRFAGRLFGPPAAGA